MILHVWIGERRFRKISQADVPVLFVVRTATRENSWTCGQLEEVGINEQSVSAMLDTTHCGWLCEADDRVVAFAMGNRSNGEMWVIAVLPDYEGKGIGAYRRPARPSRTGAGCCIVLVPGEDDHGFSDELLWKEKLKWREAR